WGGRPVTGQSVPSYLALYCTSVGFPSASIPFRVYFTSPPVTSYVRVWLFGGGPGLNFDCAGLSSHVPAAGSAPCAERLMGRKPRVSTAPKASVRKSGCI